MKLCLMDTGPVIACLDPGDAAHDEVVRFLESCRVQFITTGAVLTECFHLISSVRGGVSSLLEFLSAGNIRAVECFSPQALESAGTLMDAYKDTPMDFADATLVLIAGKLGVSDVLTLDERGFRIFRFARNKPFRLILQDHSSTAGH